MSLYQIEEFSWCIRQFWQTISPCLSPLRQTEQHWKAEKELVAVTFAVDFFHPTYLCKDVEVENNHMQTAKIHRMHIYKAIQSASLRIQLEVPRLLGH